jgi:hypothetical protein
MKPVGKPDAGNPHVRFDERGWETDRSRGTAPILDSTGRPAVIDPSAVVPICSQKAGLPRACRSLKQVL